MHHDILIWILVFLQGLVGSMGFGGREGVVFSPVSSHQWSMKLVNETVSDEDLARIHELGISVISGEWGMDDIGPAEVLGLLDRVQAHQLKIVINFSDGSAWGYAEDGSDTPDQKPVWQTEKVQLYLKQIKHHPAIYGYDISNEAGENLPNGQDIRITSAQLRGAAQDVRAIDPGRPISMRMHYWDAADTDFDWKNPFVSGVVDIVMLNLYSNYTQDGYSPALPTMIADTGQHLIDKIHAVDPYVRIWVALAAFREEPQFVTPSPADLQRDIKAALALKGVDNIGFFGWGPERFPTQGQGWYLPRDGAALLTTIHSFASDEEGAIFHQKPLKTLWE